MPFLRAFPPLKSVLLKYILALSFAFRASNTQVSAGPLTQRDGEDSQRPHIKRFFQLHPSTVKLKSLSFQEAKDALSNPWQQQAVQSAMLGPDQLPQFQRDSSGGQSGLGSAHKPHACVLHLNRTLDAGV